MSEQRTHERLTRQIQALERQCDHHANVIAKLADALYLTRAERDLLAVLRDLIRGVAARDTDTLQ